MNENIITIPFTLNGYNGTIAVCYEENQSARRSGFNLLNGLGFDASACLGYPTMHARIRDFAGTGYAAACGWIQAITDRYYDFSGEQIPTKEAVEVDNSPAMREAGVPFFALGYPAEIYDAPCNNLGSYARLEWIADTFLVTMPSRINNDTVSYLAGFRWGYEEWDADLKRNVSIRPLEIIDQTVWEHHLPTLRRDFSRWHFE